MTNSGFLTSSNAVFATAESGSGLTLTDWNFSLRLDQIGSQLNGGVYYSCQGFWELDTTQIIESPPDHLYFYGHGSPNGALDTLYVAAYNYGTLTTGDWLSPATLGGLTPIGSVVLTSTSDFITFFLDVDISGLTWSGNIRLIFYTDNQVNSVVPTTYTFFEIDRAVVRTSYSDPGAVGSYATEVAADSPTLWWRLDETSGTVAADSSGNAHDGTYTNSPLLNQSGLMSGGNKAVVLSNADDSKVVGVDNLAGSDFSSTGYSLECVVNDLSAPDFYRNYCGFEGTTEIDLEEWDTIFDDPTRNIMALFGGNASLFAIDIGTPMHVIGSVPASGSVNASKVLVNGDVWQTIHPQDYSMATSLSGTTAFYAGGDNFTGDAMDGTLDEAAFYSSNLSISRCRSHFKAARLGGPPIATLNDTVGITDSLHTSQNFAFLTDAVGITNTATASKHQLCHLIDAVGITASLMVTRVAGFLYVVTKPNYCKDPSYHPDGTKVIFAEKLGSAYNVSTVTTLGVHTVLHTGSNPYADPSYAPDGEYILFAEQTAAPSGGHTYGNWAIKYIDPDNVVHTIVSTTNANMHPVWVTPTQIAFQRLRYGIDSTFHIVMMDLAGTEIADLGAGEYPRLVSV